MDWTSFLAFGCRRLPGSGRPPLAEVALVRYRSPDLRPDASASSNASPPEPLPEDRLVVTFDRQPPSPEVIQRLRSLVAGQVVVGFDPGAGLGEIGVTRPRDGCWIDLSELGSLLLPGLSTPAEPTVRQALGLSAEASRGAIEQAASAAMIFERMLGLIGDLDVDTLMHVNRLAAPLAWPLLPLFREAERQQMRRALDARWGTPPSGLMKLLSLSETPTSRARPPSTPAPKGRALPSERLGAMLSQSGAFGRRLPGFEERPEQQAMVRRIAEAFNQGGVLLVEAGTGTGKSLAYLLPAASFAVSNSARVVVSTNTINLQDQLFQKDVPAVRDATGLDLRAAVLKGRTNYLCLRRWFALLRSEDLEPHERSLLIKTLFWVPKTSTGDKAELRLVGREEEAWNRVCAVAETCTPLHCQFHRAGICFLARARRAAEDSHLIIVNHALLLADSVATSRVLPDFDHVVIDEAHHLEDEATSQFGWRISYRELAARLRLLLDTPGAAATGLLAEIFRLFRQSSRAAARSAASLERVRDLERALGEAVECAREGLDRVSLVLQRLLSEHAERSEGQVTLRLSTAVRAQPRWSEVEIAWDEAAARCARLQELLNALLQACEEVVSGAFEEWEETVAELAAQLAYWTEVTQQLSSILAEAPSDAVAWLSASRHEELAFNAAPLHVGPLLQQRLFRSKETVVLTSATLSTSGHFRYIKERLGLEDAGELLLGSPFDYRQAALVYLPNDLPEPAQPGYQERVQAAIHALATALGGRCLVLFTSFAQLRATYEALAEPLMEAGIALLAQGQDGASRAALLDAFRANHRAVLLGTSSFWEGVDVVGEALSCLVMPRLPFSVPTDPVFAARSELFDDPFGQYAVPQAILRFKQGFGRLIRSRRDRGAVVLLDRRVETKFYGRAFLRSLPGCTVQRGPLSAAAPTVQRWLEAAPRDEEATRRPVDAASSHGMHHRRA